MKQIPVAVVAGLLTLAAQSDAAVVASSLATECVPLASSMVCGSFVAYAFNTTAMSLFTGRQIDTMADFDDYMSSNTFSTSSTALSFFQSKFNCPSWAGDGLRYMMSYACLWAVETMSAGCNTAAHAAPTLCPATWTALKDALRTVTGNASSCPTDGGQRNAAVTDFLQLGEGNATTSPGTCIQATPSEAVSCGFGTNHIESALTFCTANPTSACCSAVPNFHYDTVATTPGNTTAVTVAAPVNAPVAVPQRESDDNNNNTSRVLAVAASAAGGAVLLVGGALAAYVVVRCRRCDGRGSESGGKSGVKGNAAAVRMDSDTTVAAANATEQASGRDSSLDAFGLLFQKSHRVVNSFIPENVEGDEIAVHADENVRLHTVFSDSWAAGANLASKECGVFPLWCLGLESEQIDRLVALSRAAEGGELSADSI